MCFPPKISPCIIRLYFRIIDLDNFIFYFKILSLHVQNFYLVYSLISL